METTVLEEIRKYLNITLLSYSRICYFAPSAAPQTRVKARFLQVTPRSILMELAYNPESPDGYLVFYSYTFIFRFKTRVNPGTDQGVYYCEIPRSIETFDRRRFARLKFESRENKIIPIYHKALNFKSQGIMTDISVGGFGYIAVNPEHVPAIDDIIVAHIDLPEKSFQAIAKIVQVREDQVGCAFLDVSKEFQLDLNELIKREIDWRSEGVLQNLKKREEVIQSLSKAHEKTASDVTIIELMEKKNVLDPLTEMFISSFHRATGIVLVKEKIEYKESTALPFLVSLNFNIDLFNNLLFNCYLSTQKDSLYKLAAPVFDNKLSGTSVSSNIILEKLGEKLKEKNERIEKNKLTFTLNTFRALETNKRIQTELQKRPSIQIHFNSSLGPFSVILLTDSMTDSLNVCANAMPKEFITMEKIDLLEPISYAALRVFSEYLKLDIREKSVTTRDQLIPRFEISVILDIFFKECEGKVILNLSKRLALKIFEILVGEPAEEFNAEVKDAVAEVTNMITGNAKSEFEKSGIYYKISLPVVIESREGVTIYARNMKFLSSVYWTSEGFFDLSFSFYKKEGIASPSI